MTPEEIQAGLVPGRYKYVSDPGKDKWSWGPMRGYYEGDCDDVTMNSLMRYAGSIKAAWDMLERGEAKIHFVRTSNGSGHAILEIESVGFIDSMHRLWRPTMDVPERNLYFSHEKVFTVGRIREKIEGKSGKGKLGMLLVAVLVIGGAVVASQSGLF